jgi:3,4-dihydroxy 2-butanone 4-phosphate synthase/GTP cyclohydrolase II
MKREFCSVEAAVDAMAAGRVIIVADSEDRENEGDFLAPAQHIDAEMIHFMISVGRGQLCVPVSQEIARRLQLTHMVPGAPSLGLPRFAIPIDHKSCTTGVSPLERANTIQAMLDPNSGPADFVRPGHVFPLVACAGGVLERTGHTETSVELTRMAGLVPAGVLCEICSRDGRNMALRDELFEIAQQHGLPIVTIDSLIDFRRQQSPEEAALLDLVADIQRNVPLDAAPTVAAAVVR